MEHPRAGETESVAICTASRDAEQDGFSKVKCSGLLAASGRFSGADLAAALRMSAGTFATPPRKIISPAMRPWLRVRDYVSGTSCNFGIAALIWVIVVHIVIGPRQMTQLETVKQLSSGLFYRTSRL